MGRPLVCIPEWCYYDEQVCKAEALYVSAGNHLVNRIGYLVTEKAWVTGIEDGVWMEDDFDDDGEDEELSDHG